MSQFQSYLWNVEVWRVNLLIHFILRLDGGRSAKKNIILSNVTYPNQSCIEVESGWIRLQIGFWQFSNEKSMEMYVNYVCKLFLQGLCHLPATLPEKCVSTCQWFSWYVKIREAFKKSWYSLNFYQNRGGFVNFWSLSLYLKTFCSYAWLSQPNSTALLFCH